MDIKCSLVVLGCLAMINSEIHSFQYIYHILICLINFAGISDVLKEGEQYMLELRTQRNNIAESNIDAKTKRELIDNIISVENMYLKATIDNLASIDELDFIFDQTVGDNIKDLGLIPGLFSIALGGTAEDAFKPNPLERDE